MRKSACLILSINYIWIAPALAATTETQANKPWIITASIGASEFSNPYGKTLEISDSISDYLHEHHHKTYPSFNVSLRQLLENHCYGIRYVALGLALYYQQLQASGDVIELNNSQFNNYHYTVEGHTTSAMFEGMLFLTPWLNDSLMPTIKAGVGPSFINAHYHDQAKSGIPADSEIEVRTHHQWNASYTLGVGIQYAVNQQWLLGIDVNYLHTGSTHTKTEYSPQLQHGLKISPNSYSTFLTISHMI